MLEQQEILRPAKKPSGCLKTSGCLLTVVSVLFILLCILLTIDAEDKMDENRAEYAASSKEYEDALMAYEADSAHLHAEYQRIQALIEKAEAEGIPCWLRPLPTALSCTTNPCGSPVDTSASTSPVLSTSSLPSVPSCPSSSASSC